MNGSPGTVSKILWHFTGGPRWNVANNRQEAKPKPVAEAYEALISILSQKILHAGQFREVVKVLAPRTRTFNRATRRWRTNPRKIVELKSERVCCLGDIPIAHLSYVAKRYGKVAIGFHRNAAIRRGFNPVLYALHEANVLQSLYSTSAQLVSLKNREVDRLRFEAEKAMESLECDEGHPLETTVLPPILDQALDDLEESIGEIADVHEDLLAFVKTFRKSEFSTIYCEREWRSTRGFPFTFEDVAMVVLPRKHSRMALLNDFLVNKVKSLKLPRTVPVVAWEDLIEH